MTQYMILIYESEAGYATAPPDMWQTAMEAHGRFAEQVGMSPTRYREEAARRGGPAPIPGCFALMWETGLPAAAQHLTSREARGPHGTVASQA